MGAIIGNFISRIFQPLWNAILAVLDAIFAVIMTIINAVVVLVIDLVILLITNLLNFIPKLPDPSSNEISDAFRILSSANKFVPLTELVALMPILVIVYGILGFYKGAKFLRGGG